MADKVIYMAGRPIPIKTDAKVVTFMDGGPSFYSPATTGASPGEVTNMVTRRPNGRVFSKRRAPNNVWLKADVNQFAGVTGEELDLLRQTIVQIAVHHDVTLEAMKTFGVLVSRGLSTHFVVNHDGTLYQCLDIYHSAWATGDNNNGCIAVDMNNPVKLEMAAQDPATPPRQVFKGKVNGSMKVMLGYTEAQYATFIALMRAFVTPLKISGVYWIPVPRVAEHCFPPLNQDGKVISRLVKGHLSYQGFLGHWHCSSNKWDPGPALDWLRILAGVQGERNSFPVLLAGYGNLTDLSGQGLKDALAAYYQNIESNETGGWYPIGANQSWHSGVHIHVDEGSPVFSMSKGTIIAVRNVSRVDLGDPSFVLVRHLKEADATTVEGEEEEEPNYWYALYMHLGRVKNEERLVNVPWMQTLLNGEFTAPPSDDYSFNTGSTIPPEKLPPRTSDATDLPAFILETKRRPFWDGDILLTNIPVAAGEQIGYSGVFGSSEWNHEPLVHIEVFSNRDIYRDAQNETKREWLLVEGDTDNNSMVNINKVLDPILKATAGYSDSDDRDRVLKTSEIQTFFSDASMMLERSNMRRMICVHQSEWSPLTDWTKTAPSAVGWPWETQEAYVRWIRTLFPFQWMTEEVSAHAEFHKEHRFYTYHPITFLDVENRSYSGGKRGTAEGADETGISEDQRAQQARMERLSQLQNKIAAGEEFTPEEQSEYDELYALADDDYDRGVADVGYDDTTYDLDVNFDTWEPGEWEPPKVKKKDPFSY